MPYVIWTEDLRDNIEDYLRNEQHKVVTFDTHGEAAMFAADHVDQRRYITSVMYLTPRKGKRRA